ncbi:hypothetical protein C8F01DRAFT_1026520 [Mycena amicta]|nr:hypothetical protein C8F01DRAFT_1026520 [Mycena amicta]
MLFLLAVVSFLTTNRSTAVPLPFLPLEDRDAPDTCKDIDNCRRLFDIVWGCLATIFFACVWVSIHPNIPPPPSPALPKSASLWRQVKWKLIDSQGPLGLRLKLMLVGLLAPELIAGFAARQLMVAWKMSKKYELSLTHGFFFCMGGFVDRAGHPIVTSEAKQSGTKTLRAIRKTTEAAIKDKSKGDAFSKGIAFFQGLWFVMQCIARTAQHLPLTELEVATLAFAVVNIFTWLLWWGKPLDVRDPLVIEVSPQYNGPLQRLHRRPLAWWIRLASLLGLTYGIDDYNPSANHSVPTFWFLSEEDNDALDVVKGTWFFTLIGEFLVAAIFGAIHCIAWHAVFPSIAELWLWRASAVLIAGITLSLGAIIWLDESYDFVPAETYVALFSFSILAYIPARLILLVLPFTALRALPLGTFVDVDWSVYIPHL